MVQIRSQNLKTDVYNVSKLPLMIKDYNIHNGGTAYYGSVGFQIPAGMRKTIRSGMFIEEYMTYNDYQEIHVMCGKRVLHKLSHDDFHNNEGKVLVLDMQDTCSRYAFVHPTQGINPTQDINDDQWNWSFEI